MSCERNINKAGLAGALSGGISRVQSKTAAARSALANRVLETVDRDGALARLARSPVGRAAKLPTDLAVGALLAPSAIGVAAVDTIARRTIGKRPFGTGINPDRAAGPVDSITLPQTVMTQSGAELDRPTAVPVYRDKKEPAVACFTLDNRAWEKRPVGGGTLLQGRFVPAKAYYFKGPLSNQDAVRIAAGQQAAHQTAGYAGQISRREMLTPTWGRVKRGLIEQTL